MKPTQIERSVIEVSGREIEIPFRPVGSQHTLVDQEWAVAPLKPVYVKLLEDRRYERGLKLMRQERDRAFQSALGTVSREFQTKLRVSNAVPVGCFALDEQGFCVINEEWGAGEFEADPRTLDSDGDACSLTFNASRSQAVFKKWPITGPIPVLTLIPRPVDDWYDVDYEALGNLGPKDFSVHERFAKCHAVNDVGIKTNYFDGTELEKAALAVQAGVPYWEAIKVVLSDPERFRAIEGELKKARNEDVKPFELPLTGRQPVPVQRGAFMGKRENNEHAMALKDGSDWASLAHQYLALEGLEFEDFSTEVRERAEKEPKQYDHGDPGLIERLERVGVLEFTEVEHFDPSLPPIMRLRLFRTVDGERRPVALEDTKRRGVRAYTFWIPPICTFWQGKLVWMDARQAAELAVSHIHPFQKGGRFWPTAEKTLDTNPQKTSMLQAALTQFVGRYGLSAIVSDNFETVCLGVAKRCFTMDHETIDPEAMWLNWRKLDEWFDQNSQFSPSVASDKGSIDQHRMYAVCHRGTDVPVWAPVDANGKRATEIKKQLANSIPLGFLNQDGQWERIVTSLFVYGGTGFKGEKATRTQLYAFPSGQAFQDIDGMFLESVSDELDEERGFTEEAVFHTLTGETRRCWTGPERKTVRCGKLVTPFGMKNVIGTEPEQLRTVETGENVDFAICLDELVNKECAHIVLKNAVRATVVWKGREVHGWLAQVQFYRTGNPGENTVPAFKTTVTKRVSRLPYESALHQMGDFSAVQTFTRDGERVKPDVQYVEVLDECIVQIAEMTGLTAPYYEDRRRVSQNYLVEA